VGNLASYKAWNAPAKIDTGVSVGVPAGGSINAPVGGSASQITPVAQQSVSAVQAGQIAYSGNEVNSKKADSPSKEKQTISPAVDEKHKASPSEKAKKIMGFKECQTCKRRKLTSPSTQETQHVSQNQSKTVQQGREAVYQSVQVMTGICPECGRVYVSGGASAVNPNPRIVKFPMVDLYA
jgi:hypothetical protein